MAKRMLAWAFGVLLFGAAATAQAEDIVVVVSGKAPVTSLTAKDLKAIYLGDQNYWGSTKISPVTYQDGTVLQRRFLDRALRMSENQFKTYWIKRIFREGGVPPEKVSTPEEALRVLSQHDGAIAFLPADDASGALGVREVYRVSD